MPDEDAQARRHLELGRDVEEERLETHVARLRDEAVRSLLADASGIDARRRDAPQPVPEEPVALQALEQPREKRPLDRVEAPGPVRVQFAQHGLRHVAERDRIRPVNELRRNEHALGREQRGARHPAEERVVVEAQLGPSRDLPRREDAESLGRNEAHAGAAERSRAAAHQIGHPEVQKGGPLQAFADDLGERVVVVVGEAPAEARRRGFPRVRLMPEERRADIEVVKGQPLLEREREHQPPRQTPATEMMDDAVPPRGEKARRRLDLERTVGACQKREDAFERRRELAPHLPGNAVREPAGATRQELGQGVGRTHRQRDCPVSRAADDPLADADVHGSRSLARPIKKCPAASIHASGP